MCRVSTTAVHQKCGHILHLLTVDQFQIFQGEVFSNVIGVTSHIQMYTNCCLHFCIITLTMEIKKMIKNSEILPTVTLR